MNNMSYSSSFINFNKLIENDPEEVRRLEAVLDATVKTRNTMSIHEFDRYSIIFKLDGRAIIGDDEYDAICRDYFKKISVYHPVHIIADDGTEVLTLPAIFSSVSCVSDLGPDGSHAIDAFTNANEATDEFNIKKKLYTEHLSKMFSAAQDQEKKTRKQEETLEILEQLKNKKIVSDGNDDIKPYIPDEINTLETGLSDDVEYL